MYSHLLSLIIFTPLIVAALLLVVPARYKKVFRIATIAATAIQMVLAVLIVRAFRIASAAVAEIPSDFTFQLVEKADWIDLNLSTFGRLSIDYHVAVDGLSVMLVGLAALVLLIGAVSSWRIKKHVKGYFLLYLLLSASVVGCFVALDFFLFYLFFEFMLLPMYFLIGMWGGPRREYAAIKFFLYTLAGSTFILIVMIGLYASVIDPVETGRYAGIITQADTVSQAQIEQVQEGIRTQSIPAAQQVKTFSLVAMTDRGNYIPDTILATGSQGRALGVPVRLLAFLTLFIGFAIKLPVVPLHTWLPDAHVEAPTPISVVLAGILLKVGGYGLIRTAYSIFPEGALYYAWWIGLLGVIAILYGAMNALAMKDLKKLIAYSSVSHMGFVLLGLASLTAEGVSGSLYQMFSHGIIAAMLFLIAGVLYDRTQDRMIAHYGGLTARMPAFTALVVIAFFASLGLPGFSGFIAEILVLLGSFNAAQVNGLLPRWMAIIATVGLILGAAYYLWTLQRMFFGAYYVSDLQWDKWLRDLSIREYLMLIPLALATLTFGIFPSLLLDTVNPSVSSFVHFVHTVGEENLKLIFQP